MNQRRFVVLDRDGTIIEGVQPYVLSPDDVSLIPRSAEGLRLFKSLGLGLIVATNQAAIGRGLIDEERFSQIQQRFFDVLQAEGIRLDGVYVCPHSPEEGCLCRKPKPGLVEAAVKEHGFDPRQAFVIGDDAKDIEFGHALGARTFLVRTGHGDSFLASSLPVEPHHVADDLLAAAKLIQGILMEPSGRPS